MKFSWRIFLATIIFGLGTVFPLEIAYASFITSSVNPRNSISSGYWITPKLTSFPSVTSTPMPTVTIQPTETPEPTNTPYPTVTEIPTPTEITTPTTTLTPEPTGTIEPTLTNTPVPTSTFVPTITMTPEPTATAEPTATMTPQPTVTETPIPPNSKTVVLNEYMPKPDDDRDWVEIYNLSESDINLTGWKLADIAGDFKTMPSGTVISAKGFMVVIQYRRFDNGGDSIFLKDAENGIIDSVTYTGTEVIPNTSNGRNPDGNGDWKKCTSPSQGLTNISSC